MALKETHWPERLFFAEPALDLHSGAIKLAVAGYPSNGGHFQECLR
jgi:hypothetical protein